MRNFREMKVWEKSHILMLATYKATTESPSEELYSLPSQIRRSCASILANIVDGCGRSVEAGLSRFLQLAAGSASELKYHFRLARDLRNIGEAGYERLAREVTGMKRMLTSLIQKLKADC